MATDCTARAVLDLWHVLGARAEFALDEPVRTRLLGADLIVTRRAAAIDVREPGGAPLPTLERYGYVWASLGAPSADLFAIDEVDEPDRRTLHAASLGVRVSAPRAIENFLDLAHFPFVHTDLLGVEPHTEVKPYDVAITADGDMLATRCRFFQPKAAAFATEGFEVEYVFRVPHPFCSVLSKANAAFPDRMDVIALFIQPLGEERIRAHMMCSVLDDVSTVAEIRAFQQTVFGQDKLILENQIPRRLPLDPRAELPAPADASSLAYRRWLRARCFTYGTVGGVLAPA